jgi:beta-phosphoglucomutase-like phosphatase (HAD superfamily)
VTRVLGFRAVVFDFDGLILDTEVPEYRSWSEEFARLGAELPRERWLDIVGTYTPSFDPIAELRRVYGVFSRDLYPHIKRMSTRAKPSPVNPSVMCSIMEVKSYEDC